MAITATLEIKGPKDSERTFNITLADGVPAPSVSDLFSIGFRGMATEHTYYVYLHLTVTEILSFNQIDIDGNVTFESLTIRADIDHIESNGCEHYETDLRYMNDCGELAKWVYSLLVNS